jgi:hypothetical protein
VLTPLPCVRRYRLEFVPAASRGLAAAYSIGRCHTVDGGDRFWGQVQGSQGDSGAFKEDVKLRDKTAVAHLEGIVAARDAAGVRPAEASKTVVYLTSETHHCIEKALRICGLAECIRPAGGGGRAQTVCERKLDAWCGRIGERVCGRGSWLRRLARSALAPSILWTRRPASPTSTICGCTSTPRTWGLRLDHPRARSARRDRTLANGCDGPAQGPVPTIRFGRSDRARRAAARAGASVQRRLPRRRSRRRGVLRVGPLRGTQSAGPRLWLPLKLATNTWEEPECERCRQRHRGDDR